jgi:hypothetical protein
MKSIYKIAFAVLTIIIFQNISAQSDTKYSITSKPKELQYSKSTPEAYRAIIQQYGESYSKQIMKQVKAAENNSKIVITKAQFDAEYTKHDKSLFSSESEKNIILKKYKHDVIEKYIIAEELELKIEK